MGRLVRATIRGRAFGETVMNVLHFRKLAEAPADENEQVLLAAAIDTFMIANPLVFAAVDQARWDNIHVNTVDNSTNAIDFPVNRAGQFASTSAGTPMLCAVMQLKTGVQGRRGRGRFYMWGWWTFSIDAGSWSGNTLVLGDDVREQLFNTWIPPGSPAQVSCGFEWVVASRDQGEGGTIFPVTELKFRPLVGVQRRRNVGTFI